MSSPPTAKASPDDAARAESLRNACRKIREQVGKIVVGQEDTIEQLLIAMLARGHCLLEGVPGLAKTLMVRSLADAMDLTFHRIQFTPDLMPADITGRTSFKSRRPRRVVESFLSKKGPSLLRFYLPTKSTELRRRHNPHCSKPCKSMP